MLLNLSMEEGTTLIDLLPILGLIFASVLLLNVAVRVANRLHESYQRRRDEKEKEE